MKRFRTPLSLSYVVVLCGALASGCSEVPAAKPQGEKPAPKAGDAAAHPHADHDHPSTGPHGGQLVELGNEAYHAELVHDDDAATVTIHILDDHAKNAVPIAATEVVINLKQGGKGEQFTLRASPQADDPSGKASRFVSEDKGLSEALDLEGAEARLVLEFDDKSYTGEIKHHHDE